MILEELERDMHKAAETLDFERAAALRDRIFELRGTPPPSQKPTRRPKARRKKGLRRQ